MKTKSIIIWVIVFGLIAWGIYGIVQNAKKPGKYDELATCIKDSGAKFYGAFWCPHCQNQKAMFGLKSAKLLPYTECSAKDGKSQLQVSIDAKIQSYPTWEFADGSRKTGEILLPELAQMTSCTLPTDETPDASAAGGTVLEGSVEAETAGIAE